eukprot:COSAG04_NODE_647_length_11596_cov_18.199878_18_plen_232_part_01
MAQLKNRDSISLRVTVSASPCAAAAGAWPSPRQGPRAGKGCRRCHRACRRSARPPLPSRRPGSRPRHRAARTERCACGRMPGRRLRSRGRCNHNHPTRNQFRSELETPRQLANEPGRSVGQARAGARAPGGRGADYRATPAKAFASSGWSGEGKPRPASSVRSDTSLTISSSNMLRRTRPTQRRCQGRGRRAGLGRGSLVKQPVRAEHDDIPRLDRHAQPARVGRPALRPLR